MKQFIILVFALLFIFSCNNKIVKFNSDKVQLLNIDNNQKFILTFESTPSSGYNWILASNSDTSVVKFINKEIEKEIKNSKILGGKVNEKWEFKANKKGKANLVFYYKRNWEDKAPIDSALYNIKVK
ncbi:protease inhibitor I42 family protein [Bacteroidota bacterium]